MGEPPPPSPFPIFTTAGMEKISKGGKKERDSSSRENRTGGPQGSIPIGNITKSRSSQLFLSQTVSVEAPVQRGGAMCRCVCVCGCICGFIYLRLPTLNYEQHVNECLEADSCMLVGIRTSVCMENECNEL